jgi:DNA-directed RNA polymerase subunit RPC12/RpoP
VAEGTGRAQPFNCPYCGEEELRPGEEERQYVCLACNRRFELKFLGLTK